jgi:hypothetical protein
VLGKAAALWQALRRDPHRDHGLLEEQWSFSGAKFGWSLRLRDAKRAVVYCTPCKGHFLACMVLGE